LYAAAVVMASILSAQKSRWQLLPLLPIAFAALHLAYGLGFLLGLMKFWNRWGEDQSKAQSAAPMRDLDKYESI
jgi:phytoene/squalene synthetase